MENHATVAARVRAGHTPRTILTARFSQCTTSTFTEGNGVARTIGRRGDLGCTVVTKHTLAQIA